MPERVTHRRRELGRSQSDSSLMRRRSNPVLALQRSIGNRAVTQVLARDPVRTGTVQIGSVGQIKVNGGNLEEWAGTATLYTVEVTSKKGKHSAKLQKLANAASRTDVKVTIAPANKAGEQLNVGGGILLEISAARVKGYAVEDGVETWRLADFEQVRRTKITHTISAG
ncbi:MAG TPA: hypothetical protein VFI54_16320 [Solirubrobacteraceae bacterium]|nr:hypothetical protein [Solirubrobacteraceae bacterium]